MISDLTIGGAYKDKQLQVEAMLVTPGDHGRGDDTLLFEVRITIAGADAPQLDEWTFYIMGSQNRIYNAVNVTELNGGESAALLVAYQFRSEFLYDVRLGFLYGPYNRIEFIEIGH
jgi:hypothetical protein